MHAMQTNRHAKHAHHKLCADCHVHTLVNEYSHDSPITSCINQPLFLEQSSGTSASPAFV